MISGYLMPKGTYILEDGHWWRLVYTSSLNFLNLLICVIGASLFAKTTVIIFVIVVICLMSSFMSFFIQSSLQVS